MIHPLKNNQPTTYVALRIKDGDQFNLLKASNLHKPPFKIAPLTTPVKNH